jgi:hypothetical protein
MINPLLLCCILQYDIINFNLECISREDHWTIEQIREKIDQSMQKNKKEHIALIELLNTVMVRKQEGNNN